MKATANREARSASKNGALIYFVAVPTTPAGPGLSIEATRYKTGNKKIAPQRQIMQIAGFAGGNGRVFAVRS